MKGMIMAEAFFYARLLSGRAGRCELVEGRHIVSFIFSGKAYVFYGKDKEERLFKDLYEVWKDNIALRN